MKINIDTDLNIYEIIIDGKKINFSEINNLQISPSLYSSRLISDVPIGNTDYCKQARTYETPMFYNVNFEIKNYRVETYIDGVLLKEYTKKDNK